MKEEREGLEEFTVITKNGRTGREKKDRGKKHSCAEKISHKKKKKWVTVVPSANVGLPSCVRPTMTLHTTGSKNRAPERMGRNSTVA